MHTARGSLEDDGIRELDVPRVAVGLNADARRHRSDGTDGGAQRQGRRVAEIREVAEAGHRVSECLSGWGSGGCQTRRDAVFLFLFLFDD